METPERLSEKVKCCLLFGSPQGETKKFFLMQIRAALEKCLSEGNVVDLCFLANKGHIKNAKVVEVNGEYFEISDLLNNTQRYYYEEEGHNYLHGILVHKPWKEMNEK